MVSDRIYDLCRPILEDAELGEEDKANKLEELLSSPPTSLKGKALEDAVLGALWQWKSTVEKTRSPASRGGAAMAIRSRSPAPWLQRAGTPGSSGGSPRPSSSMGSYPPGLGPLARTKSSTASPFSSPKPSPRLPVATPAIPHSPRLSIYQFNESSPSVENYGDYGSDTVDWLVNDDASSSTSFGDSGFNMGADFASPCSVEMTPYDMLRSILQDTTKTDEELEQTLEANGYDLSQTILALMSAPDGMAPDMASSPQDHGRTILIGKSMSPSLRPATPVGQQKSPVVCRYWLASGNCARADCRFAHEVQNHVCKYWLQGHCLAGNNCLFSHDPSSLVQQMSFAAVGTSPGSQYPNFHFQDFESFPALQPTTSNPYEDATGLDSTAVALLAQQSALSGYMSQPSNSLSSNGSLGATAKAQAATNASATSQPNFQDDEAFPTLGSAATKPSKRHHGKRGGHGNHASQVTPQPNSLADIVRLSPSPAPSSKEVMRRGLKNNRSFTSTRENGATALAIPAPINIPWLETGIGANHAYMKARQEAIKHGGLRNRFLQSAAQAWNRNDARGAKALSLRGQNENTLMREKHREAAQALYDARNAPVGGNSSKDRELYVDMHGLHPEEAISYLSDRLRENRSSSKPLYVICGTGHHSKNGKDKVGKAIRAYLSEWRYAFREFSVPGDRNNVGGILGIDPSSYDREVAKGMSSTIGDGDSGVGEAADDAHKQDTKVLLVKDDPRKLARSVSGK